MLGDVLGELVRAEHAAQRREQVRHRGLLGERDVLAGDRHRHARGDERAAQHGQAQRGGPDEHRHARPRQVVVEMGAAQRARHVGRLLGAGAQQPDLDGARRHARGRLQRTLLAAARQPQRDPAAGREQRRTGAT